MRRFVVSFFVLVFSVFACCAQVKARVSENVELMCILARLAQYQEFQGSLVEEFAQDVNSHFAAHKNHPAVEFIWQMRGSIA